MVLDFNKIRRFNPWNLYRQHVGDIFRDVTDKILCVYIKDLFMDDPLFYDFIFEDMIFKRSQAGLDLVNLDRINRGFAFHHDLSDLFTDDP